LILIAKELRESVLSARFAVTSLLCVILMAAAAGIMIGDLATLQEDYDAARALHARDMDPEHMNEEQIFIMGINLDKPPSPLMVYAAGIDPRLPNMVNISLLRGSSAKGGQGEDAGLAVFGSLDVASVVLLVLSLAAILLTYDAVAGEKERGTLKLLLSNAVPRDMVLLGKFIGRFMVILIPFLTGTAAAFLLMVLWGGMELGGAEYARLGLLTLLSVLYIGVFCMLGLFISCVTKKAATALLILLLLWVVGVYALPRASSLVAGALRPMPPASGVEAERSRAFLDSLKGMMGGGGDQDNPFGGARREWAKLDEYVGAKARARTRVAGGIARLSPSGAYLLAAMRLADTGPERHDRFLASAGKFDEAYTAWVMERFRNREGADPPPRLDMRPDRLDDALNSALFDIVLLAGWCIVLFAGSWVAMLRYDVT